MYYNNGYNAMNGYLPNYNNNYNNNYNKIKTEVVKVRGYESARAINLAPNSSILLLDESEPIVWLCTSDGIGTVTATPYDISPHQVDEPKTIDTSDIEQRLANIEEEIKTMKGERHESNIAKSKHNSDKQSS